MESKSSPASRSVPPVSTAYEHESLPRVDPRAARDIFGPLRLQRIILVGSRKDAMGWFLVLVRVNQVDPNSDGVRIMLCR